MRNYQTVRDELIEYGHDLTNKKEILLLTKVDMVDELEVQRKRKELEKVAGDIISLSIHDEEGQERFKNFLFSVIN